MSPEGESYDICARCKVDRAIYTNGDPEGTYVAMDYAAFKEVAQKVAREHPPTE